MQKKHIQKYCTCTSGKHMYTYAHTHIQTHTHTQTKTYWALLQLIQNNISDFKHALTDWNFTHSYTHPHSLQLSPPSPHGASDPCPQNHESFCGLPQRLLGLEHPHAVEEQKKDRKTGSGQWFLMYIRNKRQFDICTCALSSSYSRQPIPSRRWRSIQPLQITHTPFRIIGAFRYTWTHTHTLGYYYCDIHTQ